MNGFARSTHRAAYLDLRQMGVGGDNAWGARPHAKYTLYPGYYGYQYRLRPFVLGQEDPSRLARQALR